MVWGWAGKGEEAAPVVPAGPWPLSSRASAQGSALGWACFHGPGCVNQTFIFFSFLLKFSFVLAPA